MSWERKPGPPPLISQTELRDGIRQGTLEVRPDGRVEWPGRGILKDADFTADARTWLAGYVAKRKKPRPGR